MKVKDQYRICAVPVAQAVMYVINEAPDYYDGELEAMQRKLVKLMGFVAAVVDAMPPAQALHVLNTVGYGWKEAA